MSLPVLRRLAAPIVGRVQLQPLFEFMQRVSLRGMNYGGTGDIPDTGELAVLRYVRERLRQHDSRLVVCDVGANVGDWAAAAVSCLAPRVTVFAFEPSPVTFQSLLARAGSLHGTRCLNFGLSDVNGTSSLYVVDGQSGLASLYARDLRHVGLASHFEAEVPVRTLDAFASENGLTRIHLLKLDVEGHELKVLRGAQSLLAGGAIDFIQFEFGGCNIDSRTFLRDFFRMLAPAYTISRVVRGGLYPLGTYRETHEVFVTANYLAELKREYSS